VDTFVFTDEAVLASAPATAAAAGGSQQGH
jgi:hypothetical protein